MQWSGFGAKKGAGACVGRGDGCVSDFKTEDPALKRGARWRPEGVFFTSRRVLCLAKRFAVSVRACVLTLASRRGVFLLCGRGRRRSCGRGRGICGRAGGCRCCLFRRFCRRGCGSSIFCGRTRLRCALAGAARRVSLLLLFFAWSEGWQFSPYLPLWYEKGVGEIICFIR